MIATLFNLRRESVYRERFLSNVKENLFMGSFRSFAEAQAKAPPSKPIGYDHADAVDLYKPEIYSYDYPALFWITRSIQQGMQNIFDLGGHIGIKYHAFKRVIAFPPELRWKVCDVPSIVEAGRELAEQRNVSEQLAFCTEFKEASGTDVFFVSGCLQYLPTQVGEILAALTVKPRRIILNATAAHPTRTIYTLNSIGFAVCPYRIEHHEALLQEIFQSGYRRVDVWRNDTKPIKVPFVPGGDEAYYVGGCFDLRT